ncbi:MAG TPA: MMPL family transporter [Thermomicrobiales bacterium]|jgi:RND superfamily putative drug exporter
MHVPSTSDLARLSARHPWRILGIWLVVLVLAGISATGLGDALTTSTNFTGTPESQQGADLLKARLRGPQPATETVIVRSDTYTVDDPEFQNQVQQVATDIQALTGVVKSAPTYYQAVAAGMAQANQMVSPDRHATIIPVTFAGDFDFANNYDDEYMAAVEKHAANDFEVLTVGDLSVNKAFTDISDKDLSRSEAISLPATILVLIVVFGALVAVAVPLVLAIVAIVVAIGLTAIVGRFTDLSFYVVNMIIMIGLAVGIDYTLLIVSRYREERRRGHPKVDAIAIAGGTATKAVVFSGCTVILALLGMFFVPLTVFHSLGAGAVLVAAVAVIGTLTLVPALLGLLGDRIDWPRRRRYDEAAVAAQRSRDEETYHSGFWGRLTHIVMKRPAVFVVLSVALLVACALPYFQLNRGSAGIETLPPSDVKRAYQILARDFSAGVLAPVEIVVDGQQSDPAVPAAITKFQQELAQEPLFGPPTVTWNQTGDLALVSTPLNADASSDTAIQSVKRLRNDLIPEAFGGTSANVYVSGGPAFNVDYFDLVNNSTPTVFAFVLGLSFLLLLLAFRSIVVPAKAIVMNLLSVGAAYGLLVLVFQKGYLHGVLGFQKTPTIEAWVPIFLFCVLFGLSMDYHVFLLSRIREHYDQTHRNRESVAVGLQATGRIITGAALIMVIVFGGFSTGNLVAFQQMGFGLAVAVFLDATVVRSVLVPSAMALIGDWNWYLPRWLHWLPDLRVEGAPSHLPGRGSEPITAD